MSHSASFRAKLSLLAPLLDDPDVTEIAVNRPGEVWLGCRRTRGMQRVAIPQMSLAWLRSLADVTASYTSQEISRERPLLSTTMPIDLREGVDDAARGGYRVQLVIPPAVEEQTIALCIRKPAQVDIGLADYRGQGAFERVNRADAWEALCSDASAPDACELALAPRFNEALREVYRRGQWEAFLVGAVRARKNIVISAGTNSGKTTLLNALLKVVPDSERLVTIEDSREVRPPQPNCVHLLYSRGGQGLARTTAVDLLEATLRLTPDRAIMGELRGAEAFAYLELLNSGHEGSMTTIHADSPTLMYDRLAQMVMRSGTPMRKAEIIDYARSLIHVVIQLKRGLDGRRYVSEIRYDAA